MIFPKHKFKISECQHVEKDVHGNIFWRCNNIFLGSYGQQWCNFCEESLIADVDPDEYNNPELSIVYINKQKSLQEDNDIIFERFG